MDCHPKLPIKDKEFQSKGTVLTISWCSFDHLTIQKVPLSPGAVLTSCHCTKSRHFIMLNMFNKIQCTSMCILVITMWSLYMYYDITVLINMNSFVLFFVKGNRIFNLPVMWLIEYKYIHQMSFHANIFGFISA